MNEQYVELIAKRPSGVSLVALVEALAECLGVRSREINTTAWGLRYQGRLPLGTIGIGKALAISEVVGLPFYLHIGDVRYVVDESGPRYAVSLKDINDSIAGVGYFVQGGEPHPREVYEDLDDIESLLKQFEKLHSFHIEEDHLFGEIKNWSRMLECSNLEDRVKKSAISGILDAKITAILIKRKMVEEGRFVPKGSNSREDEFFRRIIKIESIRDTVVYTRSLWDKIFELTPLFFTELDARKLSGKSKRVGFQKLLVDIQGVRPDDRWSLIARYVEDLRLFEERYRTPEFHLHGGLAGRYLRTGALDYNEFITIWNDGLIPILRWRELVVERLERGEP